MSFIARVSRWRTLLLFLFTLGFVAGGAAMAGLSGNSISPGREWIGWAGIVFFGGLALVIAPRFFDSDEQLRISALGIYWKQWSGQTIPWSEIADISVWEHQGQKMMVLKLKAPERFRSTRLLTKVARFNKALTGGDIIVSLTGTDGRFDDALAAAHRFWTPRAGF